MKTKLLALALLAGSSLFAAPRIAIGVGVGVPAYPAYPAYGYVAPAPVPPPPVVPPAVAVTAAPVWVNGYWYNVGPHRYWHAGYWSRPAVRGGFYRGYRR